MSELTHEGRAVLDAATGMDEPGRGDEARVRTALERTLRMSLPVAAVAGTAVGGAAVVNSAAAVAAAATTGKLPLVVTIGVVVGLGAAGTAGTWLAVHREASGPARHRVVHRAAPEPAAADELVVEADEPLVRPAAPPPPAPVRYPTPVAPPAVPAAPRVPVQPTAVPECDDAPAAVTAPDDDALARQAAVPQPDAAAGSAGEVAEPVLDARATLASTPPPARCGAEAEARWAGRAELALQAGQAAEGLAWLDAYQRSCPSGSWSGLAWHVRVAALCQLDRYREATSFVSWFRAEHPNDALRFADLEGTCPDSVILPR